MKNLFEKVLLFISGAAFFCLNMAPDMASMLFNVIMILLLLFFFLKFHNYIPRLNTCLHAKYCIPAAALCVIMAFLFYMRWTAQAESVFGALTSPMKALFLFVCLLGIAFAFVFVSYILNCIHNRKNLFPAAVVSSDWIHKSCLLLAAVGILSQISASVNLDIWADESFSLSMIMHSYPEIVALTAADVHPPLYYFILKFFVDIVHSAAPAIPVIYLAKIASAIPFWLILVLLFTKVRKNKGEYAADISAVCLMGAPFLAPYAVEIRMYSWALFFVFAAYLAFCDIVETEKFKHWAAFVAFSLAAAYTHYFSCVAVALLHLALLVYYLKMNRKKLKHWLFAALVTAAGYLPWLFVFIKQATAVSQEYWISAITPSTILSYAIAVTDNVLLLIVCIVAFWFLFTRTRKEHMTNPDTIEALTAFFIPIGTVFVGVLASVLIRPVFIIRYIVPGLMCLWFGVVYATVLKRNETLKFLLWIMLGLFCFSNIMSFTYNQTKRAIKAKEAADFLSSNENAILITTNSLVLVAAVGMCSNTCYLYTGTEENATYSEPLNPLIFSACGFQRIGEIDSLSDSKKLFHSGAKIYCLDTGDDFIEQFVYENGAKCKHIGNYLIQDEVGVYEIIRR